MRGHAGTRCELDQRPVLRQQSSDHVAVLFDNTSSHFEVKEADEEAGIPAYVAERAVHVHTLRYRFSDEFGFHDDTIHVFDLDLPVGFRPRATDGEVAWFELWRPERLVACLADTRAFKTNAALVVIDWLLRCGLLDAHPEHDVLEDHVAPLRHD